MSSSSCPVNGDPYRALGGMEGCRKLAVCFYGHVARDPVLQPLFPGTLRCATQALTVYLAQFLGGPCEYSKQRWSLSLREAHLRFKLGLKERDSWLKNMRKALAESEMDQPTRDALGRFFEESSAYLLNQTNVESPANSSVDDIARRWQVHRLLEEAVAAVRAGQADRVLDLLRDARLQALLTSDRAAFLSLLAIMSASEPVQLLDYVERELTAHPEIAHERYTYNRTLLHEVTGAGSARIVAALLLIGADPNALDEYGHSALYFLGNSERLIEDAGARVRLLANAGANLDAKDHVKQCTALHMAARRGNVRVAEALLDCGAELEVRDIAGDTPLRRAVNCGKVEVASLLLSRGANVHSVGSKGRTPSQAARGGAMKNLLHSSIPDRA